VKFIIAAALITFGATQVSAATVEECELAAERVIQPITMARDEGISPSIVIQYFIQQGMTPEYAVGTVQYIYVRLKGLTPEEVVADFMNNCVGEPA
jgi:hypothetical protein